MIEYLKNPIVIGIIASIIIFGILYFINKDKLSNLEKDEYNKCMIKHASISIVCGIIIWFGIVYYNENYLNIKTEQVGGVKNILSKIQNNQVFSESYKEIKKNKISTPNLDVFLDIAPFN